MNPPLLPAGEALRRHVRPGDRVLLGTAAGTALTLQAALVDQRERFTGLRVCAGLQLGGYDFMPPVRDGDWRFDTWQVLPPIRDDVANGTVAFHSARGALVTDLIRALRPDVFLTVVSPPDGHGNVSFGASVSYALEALDIVPKVIAEVNPGMPFTHGRTTAPADRFTALVDAAQPLPTHRPAPVDDVSRRIAERVYELLPRGATLQTGLGGVPEALAELVTVHPPEGLRLFGMGVDGMIDFLAREPTPGAFAGGELLGSLRLYEFAHDNHAVELYPIRDVLAVPALARIPSFVSLNGAIEVDLQGQVNSEWADGRQVSAPGGAFDFVDGAWFSEGGLSVIALRSTAKGGTVSAIVPRLAPGTPVTIPRHSVRWVVTEHGRVDLLGLDAQQRPEALVAIADPRFRDELADAGMPMLAQR